MYLFTQQGLSDLIANRDEVGRQLIQIRRERVEHGSRPPRSHGDDGDCCSEHVEIERQSNMQEQRLLQLNELIRMAVVVEMPTDTERLCVGHIVTIQRRDADGKEIGNPERYMVGGFDSTDMKTTPLPVLSYTAPVIVCFMGRTVDPDRDPTPLTLGGKSRFVELLKIELPTKEAAKLKLVS